MTPTERELCDTIIDLKAQLAGKDRQIEELRSAVAALMTPAPRKTTIELLADKVDRATKIRP
jgi:hypothetical protein